MANHQIKYFDKASLTKLNNYAIKHELNRTLEPKAIKALSDELLFPIVQTFGQDSFVRTALLLNQSERVWLDMSWEDYFALPIMEIEEPTLH